MKIIEIILTGIGLSMDAFAVSICKGLMIQKKKESLIIALYFSLFQMIMPLIGYFFGNIFMRRISTIDHWMVFFLLGMIGIGMIIEQSEEKEQKGVSWKEMIPLAIATSIDALAVGMTFSILKVKIFSSVCIIGIITFLLSFLGVKIGNHFGNQYEKTSKIVGGIILIMIGLKILLEHLV